MLQTGVVEKIKTQILCLVNFSQNHVHNLEKCCKVGWATVDTKIRRMLFACWITKATNTHSEYVIFIDCPLQQWLRERTWMLHYTILPVFFYLKNSLLLFIVSGQLKNTCLTSFYCNITGVFHYLFSFWCLSISAHLTCMVFCSN
jgi:hypothetical protein